MGSTRSGRDVNSVVNRQTPDRKVAGLIPSGRFFFVFFLGGGLSPELTYCADSHFGIRSIPVLPQWHIKDPRSFCQSAVESYIHS